MKRLKGFITYSYRGAQYFEKPKSTYISKIEYDEEDNTSIVYLKRDRFTTELLCLVVLCIIVYFVYNSHYYVQVVHMPDKVYYYNGNLYINMVADESNRYTVRYSIAGSNGVLYPGESLDYVAYTYMNQVHETIIYTVKIFGIEKTFSRDLPISLVCPDNGGIDYERY